MSRKPLALVLAALGIVVLVSSWGDVSDWAESLLRGEVQVRHKKVVYWTSSGSPEVDLKRARQFEQMYPDINIEPNFRETGGLQDILFMSFLSGNPPDYMEAKVNELRKYVLIGGARPLDDLLAAENERLWEQMTAEALAEWREAYRRDQEADPGPGAVAEARERLARQVRQAHPEPYFEQFQVGKARLCRFNVNPDDRFIREMEQHPLEAARLLAMNGKAVALRDVSMPETLTYNKRLFREAAKMFPEAGLLDERGEPIPPATWLEFYKAAEVLTRFGREVQKQRGLAEPYCYGVVLQGQRYRDLYRGIKPLAWRAGSIDFAFGGDTSTVHQHFDESTPEGRAAQAEYEGRPIGHFEFGHDAFLGAFALLFKLDRAGFVLPGTEARHYEDVRTALASGKAAMLLDGWHAALIGAERVPWAAQDLGSAPIPRPYREGDAAERDELYELLSLREAGVELSSGNRLPRTGSDKPEFFTSLCRFPDATWEWKHFPQRNEEIAKAECRRGTVRMERIAMEHLGDPEWFPYPYQMQVYDIIEDHCAMWPERPLHSPPKVSTDQEVFYKYFYQQDLTDVGEVLKEAREECRRFAEETNRDLARRIQDGVVRPEVWTFPEWDPTRAEVFFERQQTLSQSPEIKARLEEAEKRLVALAKGRPELDLLDESGEAIRDDVWRFRPTGSPWQVLWVPALALLFILAWFAFMGVREAARRKPGLRDVLATGRKGWPAYVFVLPGMLAIFGFAFYPTLYQLYLAVHSGDGLGPMKYVGWENFTRALSDWPFWGTIVPNTLIYIAIVAVSQIVVGMLFACLLNVPLKANRVYRVLYLIPLATSLAVVSVILMGLLRGRDSGLNELLQWLGRWGPIGRLYEAVGLRDSMGRMIDWLGTQLGIYTIAAVGSWHGLAFRIIVLLAGLQSISPELYEAAKVDGASAWKRFWHITIPEMLPILVVIAFIAFIDAARGFSPSFVLTEGGIEHSSELVAVYIFKWGFMKPEGQEANLGYAAALSVLYAVMLGVLTLTNVIIIARRWKRRLRAEQAAGRAA